MDLELFIVRTLLFLTCETSRQCEGVDINWSLCLGPSILQWEARHPDICWYSLGGSTLATRDLVQLVTRPRLHLNKSRPSKSQGTGWSLVLHHIKLHYSSTTDSFSRSLVWMRVPPGSLGTPNYITVVGPPSPSEENLDWSEYWINT